MEHEPISTYNLIDAGIGIVMLLSILIGIVRGFVKESLSLLTWMLALLVGFFYFDKLGDHFLSAVQPVFVRYILSLMIIVLTILIVGGIINYLFSTLIKSTGFSIPDRIIGALFGIGRGLMMVTFFVAVVTAFPKLQGQTWTTSKLIPKFMFFSDYFKNRFDLPEKFRRAIETGDFSDLPSKKSAQPDSQDGAML
jgi:membrane protein required for colicin V production